jgi:hypothetical protein
MIEHFINVLYSSLLSDKVFNWQYYFIIIKLKNL